MPSSSRASAGAEEQFAVVLQQAALGELAHVAAHQAIEVPLVKDEHATGDEAPSQADQHPRHRLGPDERRQRVAEAERGAELAAHHRLDGAEVAEEELDARYGEPSRELPALAHPFDADDLEPLTGEPARVLARAAAEIDDPAGGSPAERPEQERTFTRQARPPVDGAVVVQESGDRSCIGRHRRPDTIF